MRLLFNGAVVAAALLISAPVWAQNPSGGNSVGTPGPNPGGPGLTPYTGGGGGGAPPALPPPAAMPPAASEAPAPSNSAMPGPHHRHRELSAYHHAKAMRNFHRGMAERASVSGDTTAQLNREELARIQSGNASNPPAPAAPMPGR